MIFPFSKSTPRRKEPQFLTDGLKERTPVSDFKPRNSQQNEPEEVRQRAINKVQQQLDELPEERRQRRPKPCETFVGNRETATVQGEFQLGPVVPFLINLFGGVFPYKSRLQKKIGYPFSNLLYWRT